MLEVTEGRLLSSASVLFLNVLLRIRGRAGARCTMFRVARMSFLFYRPATDNLGGPSTIGGLAGRPSAFIELWKEGVMMKSIEGIEAMDADLSVVTTEIGRAHV